MLVHKDNLPALVELFGDAWGTVFAIEHAPSDALLIIEVIVMRGATLWRVILDGDEPAIRFDTCQSLDGTIVAELFDDGLAACGRNAPDEISVST